jgi:hypothetical protein
MESLVLEFGIFCLRNKPKFLTTKISEELNLVAGVHIDIAQI